MEANSLPYQNPDNPWWVLNAIAILKELQATGRLQNRSLREDVTVSDLRL
jgi:hypothetical protein